MNTDVGRFLGLPLPPVRNVARISTVSVPLVALTALALSGCIGFAGFETAALESLFRPGGPFDTTDGGNVVISYSNQTNREASWTVTWGASEDATPTVVTVQTPPRGTSSVRLEGPVRRIALGSTAPEAPAVVLGAPESAEKRTVGPQTALRLGRDFQPGDIISFTLVHSGSARYTITTEVISGG